MEIIDFGVEKYGLILERQISFFENLISDKKEGRAYTEAILIGEHLPVITLGRRAKEENVLFSKDYLKEKGIEIYHIGRGGDVTYHCPGQMIVYPILNLEKYKLGVKVYVNLLEETVIHLVAKYGIQADRVEGATGVWIGKGTKEERKICAIGIKCSHFCTMHGIALNVTSDLSGFSLINPCGFKNKGVTSIQKEIPTGLLSQEELKMEIVKKEFLEIFSSLISQ